MLTTKPSTNTIPMLFVIEGDRHCMPTSDYYFTNIQPDPIVIPPHSENNSGSTSQHTTAKDQIPQQTDTLRPGKTRVYPFMLAEKKSQYWISPTPLLHQKQTFKQHFIH